MTSKAEELYLEAEADIRNSHYHDAFQKHESIIYDEPDFAPSHNSLGWLYRTQFDSYEKAEMHFKAAIKCDSLYPHPYYHLATLYADLERVSELKEHLDQCLKIVTVEKAWIYNRYGVLDEIKGKYDLAIKLYQKAILHSLNNDKIRDYQADIDRCKTKQEVAETLKPARKSSE